MKKIHIIIIVLIIISFITAIYLYQVFPDKIASHWNTKGEVDGYMSKFWGVFLMPIVALAAFLLFLFLPKIDPMKNNIKKFEKYYDGFILVIILFFIYIYILTVLSNLNIKFNMSHAIIPALGIFFYYIGVFMKKLKRNSFVGIKTPWTLSSDKVWDKTHALGSKLFKIIGVLFILGLLYPDKTFMPIMIVILLMIVYLFVYSYIEHRKEKNENSL